MVERRRGPEGGGTARGRSRSRSPDGRRHSRRSAGGQGDRRRLWPGRGGQDHHGRRRRRCMAASAPRQQGAGPHRRPGQAAGQRARPERDRQCRAPGTRRGLPGGRAEAPGRAVGGHARHEGVVGRPDPAPCPRPADQGRDPGQPALPNISGRFVQSHDYIAMERLYEIHSEGDYDLIVVDTPPTRNALDFLDAPQRVAEFFSSRLLALAHRPLPVAARERRHQALLPDGRPYPGLGVPVGHRRVLHPLPVDARRVRGALRGRRAPAGRPPHDVHGRLHPRGRAPAGGRVLCRAAHRPAAPPRGHRVEQGAARLSLGPTAARWPRPCEERSDELARSSPRRWPPSTRCSATPTRSRGCSPRWPTASSTSRSWPAARWRSGPVPLGGARRAGHRALLRHRHLRPRRPGPAGRADLGLMTDRGPAGRSRPAPALPYDAGMTDIVDPADRGLRRRSYHRRHRASSTSWPLT